MGRLRKYTVRLQYPRIPHDEKKSVKLTCDDIEHIKKEYAKGKTLSDIASMFSVTPNSIKYWVDPVWRMKKTAYDTDYIMNLYRTDPYFKKKVNSRRTRRSLERRHNDPAYYQYHLNQDAFEYYERRDRNKSCDCHLDVDE